MTIVASKSTVELRDDQTHKLLAKFYQPEGILEIKRGRNYVLVQIDRLVAGDEWRVRTGSSRVEQQAHNL